MTSFIDRQLLAMTSAASSLGSIQSRIDLQENFVASLIDVIDKGIGRLVDAEMNEESTRLKALQTQQQLGIQSLSIANTNAENILTLFRQ
jgi:flagellin